MKTRFYRMASLCLVIALFPMLLACHTPAGRSAGEVVDDSTITTKVKTKLFDDDQLSGFAIKVTTFKGEVTLTGAVESAAQKARATILAKNVSGVTSVNNLLQIKQE